MRIEKIVKEALSLGRKSLNEPEAKEILLAISVPVPEFRLAKNVEDAILAAEEIGYPVVLKIVSGDILHKSDIGGVTLNIKNGKELEENWASMIFNMASEFPSASVDGLLVEKMVPAGREVIIGVIKDPQFGPLVMFGTGGVTVELMKDVSFRLGPVTRQEAFEMIGEVKGFPLLTGYRGDTIKDLYAISDIIMKLSKTVAESDGIKEFEINPLIVYEDGCYAVDARAIIG